MTIPETTPSPATDADETRAAVSTVVHASRRRALFVLVKRWPYFFALVVIPLIFSAIYLFLVAPDRFVSEAKLTVKRASGDAIALNLGFLGGGAVTEREDSMYLRDYILSPDMLNALEKSIDIARLYRDPNTDPLSRLPPSATRERFLDYFRSRVHVHLDNGSSVITIKTQAFSPQAAKQIAEAIIQESDRFVNVLSNRVANEQLIFVARELEEARRVLQAAKGRVGVFQDQHTVLDPAEEARSTARLVGALEAELAKLEAEQKSLAMYLNDSAPQVITLDSKVRSLRAQIAVERRKIVGSSAKEQTLGRLALDFQGLQVDAGFALDRYKAALQVMEKTRVEASKRVKSLVVITTPQLAEESEEPRRLYIFMLILISLCLGYGIGRMFIATINDHID